MSGTRRNVAWALGSLTSVVLLFGYRTSTGIGAAVGPPGSAQAGAYTATLAGGTTSASASGSRASASSTARTVSGDTAQTRWGPVQVRLRLQGGKITRATVLQYPSSNPRSQEINAGALPTLTRETIDAQSAGVAMVSGATVTSGGYLQSLQSALDRAGL